MYTHVYAYVHINFINYMDKNYIHIHTYTYTHTYTFYYINLFNLPKIKIDGKDCLIQLVFGTTLFFRFTMIIY